MAALSPEWCWHPFANRNPDLILAVMAVRVLIVDDQEPFRLAARAVVEATNDFEVVGEVETGEASIEAARELAPDLILMDINLPGIDGFEATRRIIQEAHEKRAVIVLVLSTYEAAEYSAPATESGAACFISKSDFSPHVLAEAWAKATAAA